MYQQDMSWGGAARGFDARIQQIEVELSEHEKRRASLMAQLGASLYEEVRQDARLRAPREKVFEAIEKTDREREALRVAKSQLEEEARAERERLAREAQLAGQDYPCPVCGRPVHGGDQFCMGCGTKLSERPAGFASAGPEEHCAQCGAQVTADMVFCMKCGARIERVSEQAVVDAAMPAAVAEQKATADETTVIELDEVAEAAAATARADEPVADGDEEPARDEAEPPESDAADEAADADDPGSVDRACAMTEVISQPVAVPGLCSNCGYENLPTARFCHNCGAPMK